MDPKSTVLWLNSPESPGPKMITLLSLEDEEEDNKECVEDHHKTLNEDSCDGQNSLTPDYAQRCSSDNESFRSQETSDSECGSVSYTGGKCVRSFDKKEAYHHVYCTNINGLFLKMFDTIHCMHWYTIIRSKISIEVSVSLKIFLKYLLPG